jgi:hypothetical protein
MPPPETKPSDLLNRDEISRSTQTLNELDYTAAYSDVTPNDFAIDIIQIEKMVQDSDSIVLDKRWAI